MVNPVDVSKVDMSLDDIIKLSKKQRRAKAGVGKGKKQGKPGGGKKKLSRSRLAEGSRPVGLVRKKGLDGGLRTKVKQLQQKARKNLQSRNRATVEDGWTPKNNKNKIGKPKNNGSQQTAQHRMTPIIGIKARLGVKGKGQTGKANNSVQRKSGGDRGGGRGRGVRRGVSEVQRPHNLLKAMRELKSTIGSSKRYGSADKDALTLATRGDIKGGGRRGGRSMRPDSREDSNNAEDTTHSPTTRRGRGVRGKVLGRGRERAIRTEPQPSSVVASQLEPPGLDLSLHLFGDHHTSKSLNHRFTPQLEGKSMHRLVQKGGRTINYNY